MTSEPDRHPGPRVIEVEPRADEPRLRVEPGPQIIATERTERVVPPEPANTVAALAPRRSRAIPLGFAGLAVFVTGWLAVDAYWWVASAFERSVALGSIAALAVAAGVAGAGAVIAREVTSLFRLKS